MIMLCILEHMIKRVYYVVFLLLYFISFYFSFRYSSPSIVNNNINIIIIKSMLTDDGEIYNVDIYIPYRRANDGEYIYSIYRRLRSSSSVCFIIISISV